ncbi:MAG: hypothetical protein Sapg2KO_48450 [Saprospiraceae bacterium]
MNIAKSIIDFFKKKDTPEAVATPAGICPNCWGREEYGGHFYARVKQENLDINNLESNVGWVQAYANKYLAGIALKRTGNGEALVCETCQVSYQHSDEHTSV